MLRILPFIVYFILSTTLLGLSQNYPKTKFTDDILNNPIRKSTWFDNEIEVDYIPLYDTTYKENILLLENGYALYSIIDKANWARLKNNVNVTSVDIIFSRYPLNKADWITNYYELLANRLFEIFSIDPSLNSTAIKWRLVMQTNCKSAVEAKGIFHGVAIGYETFKLSALKSIPIKPFIVFIDGSIGRFIYQSNSLEQLASNEEDYSSIQAILYPESIHKRNIEHYMPPKVIRPNEPDCPTFHTRMQKPKRSIWSRIFRR
jgi:hypothetical protein